MQGKLKSSGSLLILLMACVALPAAQAKPAYVPQVGDIVFHTSTSSQSKAVQAATRSPYSHMGVVLFQHGKPFVFEAVQPVKYTPLQAWLDRGQGGRYVVKRPRQALTPAQQTRLSQSAKPFVGKPYDLTFEWSTRAFTARSWSGRCTSAAWACSWRPWPNWAALTCATRPCRPSCASVTASGCR